LLEEHIADLTGIAVITTVAVCLGFVLVRLRQPPIVGYILTGVVLGPTGLALVSSAGAITLLAELGVIMLLFLVGMEISARAFTAVAGTAAAVAAGQIIVALLLSGIFGALLGWPVEQILLLGFIVAISSTAVAIQMLEEIGELRTAMGRVTVGVLIAQDIAVVPMLIVVASLGAAAGETTVVGVGIKVGIAGVLIFAFMRYLGTRPGKIQLPFTEAIRGRVDMVALASIAFCFGAATFTAVAGLSAAFGAFLAGLLIAASTLRAEAIAATHPIQSVLIVVFFLSIGLLIDLDFILANIFTVLVFVAAVLAVKSVVNVVLLRVVRQPWELAFPAGLAMAQIGEFSFVLAATGFVNGGVTADAYRLAIAVIATSLLVSPLWMASVRRFDAIAKDGISDFRAALAEVYAGEIGEFERGRAAIGRLIGSGRRRAKALWLVMERRGRKAKARRSEPADPVPDAASQAEPPPKRKRKSRAAAPPAEEVDGG
jgi:CPA2 family monovalent cation:H+ antiporter-2